MLIQDKVKDLLIKRFPQHSITIEKKTKAKNDPLYWIMIGDSKITALNLEQMEYDFKFLANDITRVEDYISKFIEDKIKEWEKKNRKRNKSVNDNIPKEKILWAIDNSKSAFAAAKLLGVGRKAFRTMLDKHDINYEEIIDKSKQRWNISKKEHAEKIVNQNTSAMKGLFDLIVEAKHPMDRWKHEIYPYPSWKLKDRLIIHGIKPEQCEICGFNESRMTDGRVPLLLDFHDGNPWNSRLDNLRFLCTNCYFLYVGTPWFIKSYGNIQRMKWLRKRKEEGITSNDTRNDPRYLP